MSIGSDGRALARLVREVAVRRLDRHGMLSGLAAQGRLADGHFRAAIYFPDTMVNYYQIAQWAAPMAELADEIPVVIITRDVSMARRLLERGRLPVFYATTIADVERWVSRQPLRAVFYVNQNIRNFEMLRFRDPAHVFLSHGESDKDYMASNQLKAYDYTFIAGQAAAERLARRLVGYDVEARTRRIGRPQVDVDYSGPALPRDGRQTVVYAPTWEGDRPSMTYSSLISHGPAMIRALVATGSHRVVYRPHPRTGVSDHRFARGHKVITELLGAANAADPAARHVVDTDTDFGWHLAAGDVCIADISAVAYDWLATGKPLILTRPASPTAVVDGAGLAGLLPTVPSSEAASIVSVIEDTETAGVAEAYRLVVARYFGDVGPRAGLERFLAAAREVITARDGALRQRARNNDPLAAPVGHDRAGR